MNIGLSVIVAKNPTFILLITIEKLRLFYPDFDILIIDSDSSNKDIYSKIKQDNIMIMYTKNKNYELGALYKAFERFNNYKIYMFLQDTLIPKARIPKLDLNNFINGNFYSCEYQPKISDGGYLEELRHVYRNTELNFISEIPEDQIINGAAHCSFITDNENVKKILSLEKPYIDNKLNKTKIDSWLSERTIGIMADHLNLNRIDMYQYFEKVHGNRY